MLGDEADSQEYPRRHRRGLLQYSLDVTSRVSCANAVAYERRVGLGLVDALLAVSGDPALQSGVQLRFFIDPSTGQPHIHGHNVTEAEAEDVLARPIEDRPGSEGSRVALG